MVTFEEQERYTAAKEAILTAYREHGELTIAFSGGKDSTCLALLVAELVDGGEISPERVKLHHADTTIEYPAIASTTFKIIAQLEKDYGLKTTIMTAEPNRRFFGYLFGTGHATPRIRSRWCTQQLKVFPFEVKSRGTKICVLTGEHIGESRRRDKKLSSCGSSDCGVKEQASKFGLVVKPILDWGNCQVWDYLFYADSKGYLWDGFSHDLKNIYEQTGSIGSLRTGCIGCPVISRKKHEDTDNRGCPSSLSLRLYDFLQPLNKGEYRVKDPRISKLHPDLKAYRDSLRKEAYLTYDELKVFFSDRFEEIGLRDKEKGLYNFGVMQIDWRCHFWHEFQPLLKDFRAAGIELIGAEEQSFIEESMEIRRYPKSYKPGMLQFLEEEFLNR